TVVANFTTEAEYVAASSCCRQVLWKQIQLLDYSAAMYILLLLVTIKTAKFLMLIIFTTAGIINNVLDKKLCFACVGFQTTPQMVINSTCLTDKKELASPGQTATGKDFSNPLMDGSFTKLKMPTKLAKKVNDEVRIQALFDGKRVNIKESSIRHTLRLDDAEGTSCLTNVEIFEGLARMGYEKPSDKLTFYKAFFSP
nr:hypothetical protein [Tanacetum cinerariifolium]